MVRRCFATGLTQFRASAGSTVDLIVLHSISLHPDSLVALRSWRCLQPVGLGCPSVFPDHPWPAGFRPFSLSTEAATSGSWSGLVISGLACRAVAVPGRGNCNDFSIGIELEGLEGGRSEAPQYKALVQLCRAIRQHYPIAHIAGHEHIAPGRKQDPGAGFDWGLLRSRLGWSEVQFPIAPEPLSPT